MVRRTILLVDDDADDQLLFIDALRELEVEIDCLMAKNGLEAIIHLETIVPVPTIVFIDLNMPLMNGFECLSRIKQDDRFRDIPVIVLTTSDNPADQKRTKELGAEMFLTKTSDFEVLKLKLNKILLTDFPSPNKPGSDQKNFR